MTTNTNESIVDRVVERLKKQPLGDLLQEADLHDIVKAAIPKVFFEPVTITPADNWRSAQKGDPLIVTIMRDLMKEQAKAAVEKWLLENQELMIQTWKGVFDKGLYTYVEALQDGKARASIQEVLRPMIEDLNRSRQAAGLPPIRYF